MQLGRRLVRNDMDVNEHERRFNILYFYVLNRSAYTYIGVSHYVVNILCRQFYLSEFTNRTYPSQPVV